MSDSESLGSLELEFVINNPAILAQLKETEGAYQETTESIMARVNQASDATQQKLASSAGYLKIQLAQLKTLADVQLDPSKLAAYNNQIEVLAVEIQRLSNAGKAGFDSMGNAIVTEKGLIESLIFDYKKLEQSVSQASSVAEVAKINAALETTKAKISQVSNAGKTGFDEFGNAIPTEKAGKFGAAISRVTDLGNIGARVVTQFSRQLIGLGVGFLSFTIGAKALEALFSYIANLDIFTGRLDQATQNVKAFNAVNDATVKSVGSSIASLQILYAAATDVNNSMADRIKYAQQIKDTYPDSFANSTTQAILNGKEADSYKELSREIVAQAKAKAIADQIGEQASIIARAQIQEAKIKIKASNERFAAKGLPNQTQNNTNSDAVINPYQNALANANNDEKESLAVQEKLKQNAQGTIDFLTAMAGGTAKVANALTKNNDLIKEPLARFNQILASGPDKKTLDNLKASLQASLDALTPGDAQIKTYRDKLQQIDDIEKQYKVGATAKTKGDPDISKGQSLLASQTSVLQRIEALKAEYANKDEQRDEQAINAVKAKFKAEVDNINALNKKREEFIADYNRTHKNGGGEAYAEKIGLNYVDPNSLQPAENSALAGLAGRQAVEALKLQVEQQKTIFAAYEDFKLKAGTETANKLYGNETKGFESYIAYLKSLEPTEAQLTSADPKVKAAASATKDFVDKQSAIANTEELVKQQKHLADLILQDEDYQQKRAALINKANKDIATLTAAGYTEQAKQVQVSLADQLTKLDIQSFETEGRYKVLFSNIAELSSKSANDLIANAYAAAKAQLAAGTITEEAYRKINDALAKLKKALDDVHAEEILSIGNAFIQIGQGLEASNANLSAFISGLGSVLASYANVQKQAAQIKADAADPSKQALDKVNLAVTGAEALFSIYDSIATAQAAQKKAAEDYYNSVIAFQNEYNLALIKQEQLQYKTEGNIFITDFAKELSDAAKSYKDATAAYQISLQQLSQGEAIVGTKNVVNGKGVAGTAVSGATAGAVVGTLLGPAGSVTGAVIGGIVGALGGAIAGLFGSKKSVDVLAPLLATYPQLIDSSGKFNEALAKTLIGTNQVTAATKTLLQNTINYYDQAQSAIDQINSALTTLSDNLGSSLDQALVSAFENGTSAAKAFGDTVNGVISNIVQQFLFNDVFESQFTALNDKLKATVLAGGTSADITKNFVDFFKQAGPLVKQFQDSLAAAKAAGAAQGLNLFAPTTTTGSGGSLAGQIQGSITADQANILEGAMHGIQLAVVTSNTILATNGKTLSDQLLEMKSQTLIQMQISQNTKRSADNSDTMVTSLKSIDSNTSSINLTNALRAAGHA